MAKPNTLWKTNATKNANAVLYSSASVLYSSALVNYTSSTVGQNELNKPASAWTTVKKIASAWQANSAYSINQYTFDSALFTYDSAIQTYDGVNGTQQSTNNKPRTAWTSV